MWKVMIADDEPFIREGIEQLIPWKSLGCKLIYSASNGRELIEYMEIERPDIIIVDIKMPVLGGLDVAKYIQDNRLNIQVIILTAYADFQFAHMAIKYNVSDYIVKTSALEDIPKALERIMEKLEETRLTSFRLLILHGINDEPMLEKLIKGVFEEFEQKEFQSDQVQNCFIITGSKASEDNIIVEACTRLQGLCRNFLGKNLSVAISQVYHDSKQVYDHYDSTMEYLKKQVVKHGTGIFFNGKEEYLNNTAPVLDEEDDLVKRVNTFIDMNYCNKITLDDIADEVHSNRSYLSRIYKQKTGVNLFNTINMKRIEQAKEYIKSGKKMYEIALQLGFEDTAYFSKVFKKFEGMGPKEYYRHTFLNGEKTEKAMEKKVSKWD